MSTRYRGYNRRRRGRGLPRFFLPIILIAAAAAGVYYASDRSALGEILGDGEPTAVRGPAARSGAPAGSGVSTVLVRTTVLPAGAASATPPSAATVVGSVQTPAVPSETAVSPRGTPRPDPTTQPVRPAKIAARPRPTKAARTAPTDVLVRRGKPVARRYYTVAPRDSLYGVAQRTGLAAQQIAAANGLQADDDVYVDQRLLIPTDEVRFGLRLPNVREKLPAPKARPLSALAPQVVRYLDARAGSASVAIYLPDSDTLYSYNPSARYLTASTVKVPIMLTQLSKRYARDRGAVTPGTDLLTPMIVVGDNDAADQMFELVGGQRAVQAELRARGITSTQIAPERWGLSKTTAPDMALLMRSLLYGERLNPPLRRTALGLLGGVVEPQRWGVPEGLPSTAHVAFKGGWLPARNGWQVHQVGIADLYGQTVVFSFFTADQPGEVYGRETLEGAARALAGSSQAR